MARRNSYPGGKWNNRPGQAYSRTAGWPTRYYQRKIGGSMIAALAGMNTTSDDFEKKEGESPYMWNARLDGTKEGRKRAQSMSRLGQSVFAIPDGAETTHTAEIGETRIQISENKSVKWPFHTASRLTSVGFRFDFDELPTDTNAHFVVILRNNDGKEICRAIRKVTDLYSRKGELEWFRFIRTVEGDCVLEVTLVDDLDSKGKSTYFDMFINATGTDNHFYSEHELPNLDSSLREAPYEWHRGLNIPVVSYKTCNWTTFPVWLQRGYFNSNGSRWSVMGIENEYGQRAVYAVKYAMFDAVSGEIIKTEPEVKVLIPFGQIPAGGIPVRMTQAGNHLYFVDGDDPLRKINLDNAPENWTVESAVPDMTDVDNLGYLGGMYYYANTIIVANAGSGLKFYKCVEEHQGLDTFTSEKDGKHEYDYWTDAGGAETLTAWEGASLIYFHNNRLFLSGFRTDTVGETNPKAEPNLVIMSSITSIRPQYDMFNRSIEFFYVPDMAQSQSSAAPVTAFSHIGDYLLIHTTDGIVIEQVESAVEFAGITQHTPEGSQYGVMRQEHVVEGRNNVYFYNPNMGVMRTAGSTASVVSGPIDSIFDSMDNATKNNIHLCMTDELLRLYYGDGGANNKSLVDYASIPQHKSYWFRDNNTPVVSTCIDTAADMYMAVHSEYPVMMLLDETLKDFDCAILYEYYTKYIGTPDRLDHCIVRRIHLTTLQTYQSSVYVGLDYDHNNKPIVWRKFITPTRKGSFDAEDIFSDDEESNATNLDIRILTEDTRFVQIRLKQYCYDFQAEILQVGFEYANRTTL